MMAIHPTRFRTVYEERKKLDLLLLLLNVGERQGGGGEREGGLGPCSVQLLFRYENQSEKNDKIS